MRQTSQGIFSADMEVGKALPQNVQPSIGLPVSQKEKRMNKAKLARGINIKSCLGFTNLSMRSPGTQ
jgi:hypothetical protein